MKIRNCPFCGSEATITEHMPKVHGKPQWQIGCEEDFCLMSPGAYGFGSKKQAIKAWNTRADVELSKTEVRLEDYAIALQQAIEHHCKGEKVPAEIALRCPYHAKLLDDTRTDDWISVKDRLPKNDDEVLVSTRLKNIGIGWWDSYWRSDLSVKEITHWMPMPAPPEEER